MLSGATKPGVFKVYYILSGRNILVVKGSGLIIASIYQSFTSHWPPKGFDDFWHTLEPWHSTVTSYQCKHAAVAARHQPFKKGPATDAELELIFTKHCKVICLEQIVMKQNREWSFNSMNLGGSLPLLLEAGSNVNKCLVEVPERIET